MLLRGFQIHEAQTGQYALAAWKNLSIAVWRDSATLDAVERLRLMGDGIQAAFPQGRSSIHLVCNGAGPPSPAAKDLFVRLMKDEAVQLVGVVIQGSGFWASALRSAITSMQLESGRRVATRHHNDVAELVEWLPRAHLERTGVALDPARLRAVIDDCLAA